MHASIIKANVTFIKCSLVHHRHHNQQKRASQVFFCTSGLRFFHGFSFSDDMEPREESVDEESDELLLLLLLLLPMTSISG